MKKISKYAQSMVDEPCNYRIYSNMFHHNVFLYPQKLLRTKKYFCVDNLAELLVQGYERTEREIIQK